MPERKKSSPKTARPRARRFGETGELRILYQMAAAIGRSLQLDDLLRDSLQSLETLLAIPMSAVYLLRDGGGAPSFHLAHARGFSASFEVGRLLYEPNKTWLTATVLQGRPYVAREPLASSPVAVAERGKREGIQSWIALPLISRGRTLGLLLACSRSLEKFDEEEVELLEALGPDLGVAIENAQLFELVQRGRNEWQATFDAVEDRIALLDRDLRLVRANRALLTAVDRAPAQVIGTACRDLFPGLCGASCPHVEAREGRRVEREMRDGARVLRVAVYPSDAGQVIHIARDVTEERRAAEQLLRAEKLSAASTVLAGTAHELNNPLTVVIAYADLLSQLDEASSFNEEIQQILRSALRCQSIVRNLLAFSRQDRPERSEIDVNQLIRETLPLFAYQLRIAGIRIEERLNPTLPRIAGDRTRLQQILVNVINNAGQAMSTTRRGGFLRLATRAGEGQVEIEITDDGPGIAAEAMGRIFEPFFTTKPPGQGTGLGLALSLQMAREHGGDIRVTSDGRSGTNVLILLPIGQAPAPRPAAEPPAPQGLAGRKILIVDDEPDLRRLVGSALQAYGAEVVLAAGGHEALQLLGQHPSFDLIFSDLRMPEMGGDDLVAELRRQGSPLADRVLLTTGDVAAPAADRAIKTSGRPCIPKPFTIRELVSAILKQLG